MKRRSALIGCICLLGGSVSAEPPLRVDLELVLAVDVSYSMELDEQQVQRQGYVAAFLEPDLIQAIENGPLGRIAVTYVEWGGAAVQVSGIWVASKWSAWCTVSACPVTSAVPTAQVPAPLSLHSAPR